MRRSQLVFAWLVVASASLPAEGQSRARLMVPAQFPTIQAAVTQAQPGDSIFVAPGRYCEQVLITKSDLTIQPVSDDQGRHPVVSGACITPQAGAGSAGFRVQGASAAAPAVNVEISGFVVEGFETGIVLQYAARSRVASNEVRDNTASLAGSAQNGIMLIGSSYNQVSGNFAHGNGHMGIGVRAASHGNIVSGNRLVDNQVNYPGSCSLMVYGNSVGNQVVDNEVVDSVGVGIMIGPAGVQTQTLVAGNRVHGHEWAGIAVEAGSQANLILGNDATGNNTSGDDYDLFDGNATSTNVWFRNLYATCSQSGC